MTIVDIYKKYQIPPNLQRHMLEVTAVGRYICENWNGEAIDKSIITQALLLHDMGNIVKFKRPFFGELEENSSFWEQIQNEFREKYGISTHAATNAILKEIGVDQKVYDTVSALDSEYLATHGYPTMEVRIANYADMCVAPEGIVGFDARLKDLGKRYGLKDFQVHEIRRRLNAKEIAKFVSVPLESIVNHNFSAEIHALQSYNIT